MHTPQLSPSPNRQTGDEKSGNHKERDDGVQAGPEQNAVQRLRKYVVDGVPGMPARRESQVNVMQDHGEDAKSPQHIDAGEAILPSDFDLLHAHPPVSKPLHRIGIWPCRL